MGLYASSKDSDDLLVKQHILTLEVPVVVVMTEEPFLLLREILRGKPIPFCMTITCYIDHSGFTSSRVSMAINETPQDKKKALAFASAFLEVPARFELANESFADSCLTTWPRYHIEIRNDERS